jgi:DNA-binding transcriptional MerR regulator
MNELVAISKAARLLGVATSTLRRWEKEGKVKSCRLPSGKRRYDLAELERFRQTYKGQSEA